MPAEWTSSLPARTTSRKRRGQTASATTSSPLSRQPPTTDATDPPQPDDLRLEIQQIRNQGWAFVDLELQHDLRSLAVLVIGADGTISAAINISAVTAFDDPSDLVATAFPPSQQAASAISKDLDATRRR